MRFQVAGGHIGPGLGAVSGEGDKIILASSCSRRKPESADRGGRLLYIHLCRGLHRRNTWCTPQGATPVCGTLRILDPRMRIGVLLLGCVPNLLDGRKVYLSDGADKHVRRYPRDPGALATDPYELKAYVGQVFGVDID